MKFSKITIAVTASILLTSAAVALHWQSRPQAGSGETSPLGRLLPLEKNQSLEQKLQKLEESLSETHQIQERLFELVEELRSRLEMDMGAQNTAPNRTVAVSAVRNADPQAEYRDRYQRHRDLQYQRLVDAGLAPERAEHILSVQERLQHDQMKLAYEYHHTKDKASDQARALQQQMEVYHNPLAVLEQQLTEQEFDLYQRTFGFRQEMRITRILENTPAQSAGLQPGDKILSYNGHRVYHFGELQSQVMQVEPGKTVAIEIQREGSSGKQTIYVPSGPLGIQG